MLNNNPFIVIENSAQLIIDNSATNAISLIGSGGNIVSEGENNKVKWNIKTSTGAYTMPFSLKSGTKIPLTLDITTVGFSNGSVLFSTYTGANWNNVTYLPSDVTYLSSACCVNNSANVIDRFWIIDPINYTTKPAVSILFTYYDPEHTAASNTIIESSLFAQRFNSTIGNWNDWYGSFGTANTVLNTVTSGAIIPANFFRSWSLVNQNNPLPIKLVFFNGKCNNNNTRLFEWENATEINNNYFTIEKSTDAINWNILATISSKGNSNTTQKYSFVDNNEQLSLIYYRLKQTDMDETSSYSDIISLECSKEASFKVSEFPNPNYGSFMVSLDRFDNNKEAIELVITNVLGDVIEKRLISIASSNHQELFNISNHALGIYYLSIKSSDKLIVKKIIHL